MAVDAVLGQPARRDAPSKDVPFTRGSKDLLERALQESRKMGMSFITPEHLALAALEAGGDTSRAVLDRRAQPAASPACGKRSLRQVQPAASAAVSERTRRALYCPLACQHRRQCRAARRAGAGQALSERHQHRVACCAVLQAGR